MDDNIWVELSGSIIIARLRGTPTVELLRECQRRVIEIVRDTEKYCVLYDALEMAPPPMDVVWSQRELDDELSVSLHRAIVVPNTRVAYLVRLAFGSGDYRVFYHDMAAAIRWLELHRCDSAASATQGTTSTCASSAGG
jgi:hypothetical protein